MEPGSIVMFIILFFLSAFFSSSETAFMSVPAHKVENFIKQKRFWAKELKKLKTNTDKLLITILIGNNLVNTLTASLATSIAMDIAEKCGATHDIAIWVATWSVTLLLLIFGEIFPKTFATRYADILSLRIAKIYSFLQIIFYPIIRPVEKLMKFLQKKSTPTKITDEEIEAFIELGKNSWALEDGEFEKLKNMLDFSETTCEEIMTPRVKIDAIPSDLTVNEAIEKVLWFSHSRILVYHKNIDKIERSVTLKELYQAQRRWKGEKKLTELPLANVLKVPLTKPIHVLLEQFKRMRRHIAIVIDEFGGVEGLVSLEDVVEEVFGDIQDETDNEIDPIRSDGNGAFLFQPEVKIEEMVDHFHLTFDDIGLDQNEWEGESLWYFIISYLETIPRKGDVIKLDIRNTDESQDSEKVSFLSLRIMAVKDNKIWDIKISINDF